MTPALILYMLGALLLVTILEPEEGQKAGFITFAMLWPIATIWIVGIELLYGDEE